MPSEFFDVMIVGSGPAGTSTALHLLQRDPAWGSRLLILEKERHPREKLCGGGLTRYGESLLGELGVLPLGVPHVNIREVRLRFEELTLVIHRDPIFRIARRAEFDAWLIACARDRGARLHEGEAVTGIEMRRDHVRVTTTHACYHAKVLVGADGSKGMVRVLAGLERPSRVARLLEVITPEDPATTPEFVQQFATFDFTPMKHALQGYYWDFPSLVGGRAHMNRGLFDARVQRHRPRAPLKHLLAQNLATRARSLTDVELQGHPLRWFDRQGPFSRPHVLLVGDAAGVDPLWGEGISFALGYGKVAAQAIEAAFHSGDFSFHDYGRRILADPLGRTLRLRRFVADLLYRSPGRRVCRLLLNAIPLVVSLRLFPVKNDICHIRRSA